MQSWCQVPWKEARRGGAGQRWAAGSGGECSSMGLSCWQTRTGGSWRATSLPADRQRWSRDPAQVFQQDARLDSPQDGPGSFSGPKFSVTVFSDPDQHFCPLRTRVGLRCESSSVSALRGTCRVMSYHQGTHQEQTLAATPQQPRFSAEWADLRRPLRPKGPAVAASCWLHHGLATHVTGAPSPARTWPQAAK